MNDFRIEDLSRILEASGIAYWKVDLTTMRISGNPLFYNSMGIESDQRPGLTWDAFLAYFTPESTEGVPQAIELLVSADIPFEIRLKLKRTHTLPNRDLSGFLIRNQEDTPLHLMGTLKNEDSSGQSNLVLEQSISDHQRMIMHSSRMSALGEMASGIAHEINNPLAIIFGKIEKTQRLLQKEGPIQVDVILSDLKKIQETSERISKIIKGLRAFSRSGDQDPFAKVGIDTIVNDTLSFCRERILNHSVSLRIPTSIPTFEINCRATQISQVLLNLLNNSFDAISEHTGEKWISLDFEVTPLKLRMKVTDSGNGIPPEVIDRMMQPFFTTKEAGKGTGLGLSISKGIIEEHRGTLSYDSTCKNTCFVIELPV
jgi:C4-dicarboxylate-specific signal transduction histidine kinase